MIPVGSSLRVSSVERAVTPNPCFFRIVIVGNVVSKGRSNAKIGGEEEKGMKRVINALKAHPTYCTPPHPDAQVYLPLSFPNALWRRDYRKGMGVLQKA